MTFAPIPAWGAVVRWPNGSQGLLLATIRESADRAHGALERFNQTHGGGIELLSVVPLTVTPHTTSP